MKFAQSSLAWLLQNYLRFEAKLDWVFVVYVSADGCSDFSLLETACLCASGVPVRAFSGCTPLTFPHRHNHAIISQLGGDMPFWLQFALVISSIHIEMRLSPPPDHNVITSLPSQRRNMEPAWQKLWSKMQHFFRRCSQKSQNKTVPALCSSTVEGQKWTCIFNWHSFVFLSIQNDVLACL